MTEFRTLPVDQAVALIRTWAELDWPVTREQTLGLRDKLGWKSSVDHEELFTTNNGFGHEDAGVVFDDPNGGLSQIKIRLSQRGGINVGAGVAEKCERDYVAIVELLTQSWGDPVDVTDSRVWSREWGLLSGARVILNGMPGLLRVTVISPQCAAQRARDVEFEEMYGFEDEDE